MLLQIYINEYKILTKNLSNELSFLTAATSKALLQINKRR